MAQPSTAQARQELRTNRMSDLYTFGGTERDIERIQRPLAEYFAAGEVVVDLGCGRGLFLNLLRERGVIPVGVDLSAEALEVCRRNGISDVHNLDVVDFLREHQESFDGAFCSHVIEHMSASRARELLEACFRSLKPGGKLILLTPNTLDIRVMGETFWLDTTHVRPYPLPLIRAWCESAGFRISIARIYAGIPIWSFDRRHLIRRIFLKLLLGEHYWAPNSLLVADRDANPTQDSA